MTKTANMKEILPAFPEENIGKRMSGIKGRVPPDNIHHEDPFKQFIGTCLCSQICLPPPAFCSNRRLK